MTYESFKLIELSGIVRLKLNGREMGGGGGGVFLSQGISPIHTVKYKIIYFAHTGIETYRDLSLWKTVYSPVGW